MYKIYKPKQKQLQNFNDWDLPFEEKEQEEFVNYLEAKRLKFTAIPNSTFTRSRKQKDKNRRMGLRPGLPDLVVCLPDKLLFVEMKRIKNGSISKYQRQWMDRLNEIPNVEAIVCYGCGQAIDAVEERLK